MPAFIDLTGRRFGRLTAISQAAQNSDGDSRVVWLCRCDCGSERMVRAANLRKGNSKSCGCYKRDVTRERSVTHGHTRDRKKPSAYRVWAGMFTRCTNPQRSDYPNYGGRGIQVCERWLKFENFYADMGDPPAGMTLDRKDNDGNYEPDNCRWADRLTQTRNRRTSRLVTFNGETLPLAEWAEKLGLKYLVLFKRLRRGWSVERALTDRAP